MKKVFLALIAIGMLAACHQSNNSTSSATSTNVANAPVIKFTEEKFDFGKIKQGDSVMHNFNFTNTGKSPLIITDAVATCGCTKPEWPKAPVQAGESGVIKVTFHSAAKQGLQDKMITITGNTNPAQSMVHLVGEVIVPKTK